MHREKEGHMKTTSWEIILAGFFFVGIAIYLVENHSNNQQHTEAKAITIDLDKSFSTDQLKGLELEHLKELENLENLSELEDLEKLKSLKSLSTFLPAEIQADFEAEINEVIEDLKKEHIKVNFSADKESAMVSKGDKDSPGKWTAASPGVYTFYQELSASAFNEADIELPFGSIEIIGSSNNEATFTIQASGQVSTKADLESKIRTVAKVQDGVGVFSVTPVENSSKDQNIHLQATLSIPSKMMLTSLTKAGHITSSNMNGEQTYHTLGGHIKLNNVKGRVQAKTNGGHITAAGAEGDFELNSLGGHILVKDSKGVIAMKTSGGNLQAIDVSGSVQASTNGGNIELKFLDIQHSSNATTGAGTISIWVPTNTNSTFNLSGSTVEVGNELNFVGNKSSGNAKGSIGSPENSASVHAKTNYGKVVLKSKN